MERYRLGCFVSWRTAGAVLLVAGVVLGFASLAFGWWS